MIEPARDDEGPAVSWSDGRRWARVEFSAPRRPYRDATNPWLAADTMLEYIVKVSGHGMVAEAPVMNLGDGIELPDFIQELAHNFRGWAGTRAWKSLEDQLHVEATWSSGGHVELRFRITPSVYDPWAACVVVPVEAGAEMQALADTLGGYLT
jgi:Family of unknown function (DUF6228)